MQDIALGEKAMAAIAAVEGLAVPKRDRQLIDSMRKKGCSEEEIRLELLQYYRSLSATA